MSRGPTIYFLASDYSVPSWGTGMLYWYVSLLREHGLDARVLHHQAPFRLPWLDGEIPGEVVVDYLDDPDFSPNRSDVVVVPEVHVSSSPVPGRFEWRRVVFVQGSFLILRGAKEAFDYKELGYEAAMAVLPHVQRIVERHYGIEAPVVPPFIAPYFFAEDELPRQKRILVASKEDYRIAGYPDHNIVMMVLGRYLASRPEWELRELEGVSHREAADLMSTSTFLINLNCLEAFNSVVPEAMAAGCIPICYEAYGGADFLRDGENAYVFPNNYVYPLLERVFELIDNFEVSSEELGRVRQWARSTARSFRPEATGNALVSFFRDRLKIRA